MLKFIIPMPIVFRCVSFILIYGLFGYPAFNFAGISTATAQEIENTTEDEKDLKKDLVALGVTQYQQGDRAHAKKTLEQAEIEFPANYAVPYYLGLIYLEEGRESAAISQWQRYVELDPDSENSLQIRKYTSLLLRKEAKKFAQQAVKTETALLEGPVDDKAIAVSTFKNLGSESLGPLGKGMAALLIHDLSQVPDLKVVERVKLVELLNEMNLGTSGLVDKKSAPKLGKLLKARHITTGSLADLEGENMQITSALADVEQTDIISTQEAQGVVKKFYDLEKKLACDIVTELGHDCNRMPKEFGKIHTKSLPALTAFSVGLDQLDQEKYDEARESLQKALNEDPKFDLAEQFLIAAPIAAMAAMPVSEIVSQLSSSGVSSSAAGTAVVAESGVGIGTTAAIVAGTAAVGAGAVAYASSSDNDSGSSGGDAPQSVSGTWELHFKCASESTDVAVFNITINESTGGNFSGSGSGTDYDGQGMHINITGTYDSANHTLTAQITTTFEETDGVRVDTFSTTLTSNDTGYIPMTQVQVTGCDGEVRLIKL
jgi:tetratricopeptide (TPR) repeat protein